ncbi:hypothetical protein SCG7109_BC_00040 [Chlamydiales bacterium SCGC AG-110-M15]|nr:hypothetical protein SCG7109_BC_00040 [Chlamydiales bacterium SCGC AG-110-M15]
MLTNKLEKSLSEYAQRKFCLMTRSGTAALITALQSFELPPDAEVIMPAITCPVVLSAIMIAGFKPVLADISLDNFCMGPDEAQAVITKKTKAIIAIHAFGKPCLIEQLSEFAQSHQLFLIEDTCLAFGATLNHKPLGSFGDITVFSFGHDKILDVGGGGALLCNALKFQHNAREFLNKNSFFQNHNESQEKLILQKNRQP